MPLAPPVSRTADPGVFLALEGGDGAGKSTQAGLLVERLRARGHTVLRTHEPGGTPVGSTIRQVLLHGGHVAARAEALLFAADRGQHVETLVRPALREGSVVVTDRYLDSSVAYQGVARGLDREDVRALSAWATDGLLPHLTVLLDVDAPTGRSRREGTHDRLEREDDAFHDAVRGAFLALAAESPRRYLVLDAAQDPGHLADLVWSRVVPLLPEPGGTR